MFAQAPNSALGFRVTVSKWLILVRLLLGEMPEHQDFTQPGLRQPLQAYYELTQAVRGGDLALFRYKVGVVSVLEEVLQDETWVAYHAFSWT